MKLIINTPEPPKVVTPPEPTYDLIGLTKAELVVLDRFTRLGFMTTNIALSDHLAFSVRRSIHNIMTEAGLVSSNEIPR